MLVFRKILQTYLMDDPLESLITSSTCFKSVTPSCTDLILTNHKQCFMKLQALVTGISDFHILTLTIMRNTFARVTRRLNFTEILKILIVKYLKTSLVFPYSHFNHKTIDVSTNVFVLLQNKYAPIKKKILRANHSPFMYI